MVPHRITIPFQSYLLLCNLSQSYFVNPQVFHLLSGLVYIYIYVKKKVYRYSILYNVYLNERIKLNFRRHCSISNYADVKSISWIINIKLIVFLDYSRII